MAKQIAPLTDLTIRNAKPGEKSLKMFDGGGLYLEVMPGGSKLWRMKYRQLNGKENRLSFGSYPEISLADAGAKRAAAHALLAAGTDPGRERDVAAASASHVAGNTVELLAREWHHTFVESWQPQTAENILHRMEVDIFPLLGRVPITD
ncbi:Integrase [Janthinobacterium sp. CG23_2]|nr:Integrase [Janthinobacterium sp. CG23_2]CUU32854.1 Integrase [Janthinobacterium sp. CG23_2]